MWMATPPQKRASRLVRRPVCRVGRPAGGHAASSCRRAKRCIMGRCNGGGGRRNGGGGFQEGQNAGKKAGKTGHGKNSGHVPTQREPQRFDKLGKPLNYGPFRNGYYVADKKQTAEAQAVGMAAEQVAALSLLTTNAAAAAASSSSSCASAPSVAAASQQPSKGKSAAAAGAANADDMVYKPRPPTAAQRKESERLLEAHAALTASAGHARCVTRSARRRRLDVQCSTACPRRRS